MKLNHSEWLRRIERMDRIANAVSVSRTERARRLCAESGLDPSLLGIHPHNAMLSLEQGQPWPGIDYSKVRACIREMNRSGEGFDLVTRWDRRVRLAAGGAS